VRGGVISEGGNVKIFLKPIPANKLDGKAKMRTLFLTKKEGETRDRAEYETVPVATIKKN